MSVQLSSKPNLSEFMEVVKSYYVIISAFLMVQYSTRGASRDGGPIELRQFARHNPLGLE